MDTQPYWSLSAKLPQFESLSSDLQVDVVVVGGGLTGITTAYLLKQAGVKVALIERARCAAADTGHTTAHLTYVTDYRLHQLVKSFGRDGAKAFWEAGMAALDQIADIVSRQTIDCGFKWVSGYLHGQLARDDSKDHKSLEEDASLARELGFDAEFIERVPYANRPGIRFRNQAKFHPLKYLAPLLQSLPGQGSHVFENTEMSQVDSDPLVVHAGQHKIRCEYLVIATHTPLIGKSS